MTRIFYGARVIDGTGAAAIERASVVVENGRIAAIERDLPRPHAGTAEIVDVTGKTIVPGFWDTHVHLYDWMGELFLAHGVTTIVDVGNYVDWILAQRDGTSKAKIRGPRILACGNALGGDPVFAERRHMSLVLDGPEDAAAKARALLDRGVDSLKVWVFAKTDDIRAAAAEAARRGRPVIGHLSVSAADAVEAGVTVLAHASGLPAAATRDPARAAEVTDAERRRIRSLFTQEPAVSAASLYAGMDESTFDRLAELFVSRGVSIEPDIVFRWVFAFEARAARYEAADAELAGRPELRYLPDDVRARFVAAWGPRTRLTPAQRDELTRAFEKTRALLRLFAERGGRLLVGSDTTGWPMPGASAAREIALLHDALGLSATQAIACATGNAARSMGRTDVGTIAPGMVADLLVVDGNPLENIDALERVVRVIRGGEDVDRAFHADYANPLPKPRIGMTHSNPIPVVSSIAPGWTTEGTPSLRMAVSGHGFVPASVVCVEGIAVPTRFAGTGTLEAEIGPEPLRKAGTYSVWVRNPLPVLITDYLHQDERSNVAELVVGFA